MHDGGGVLVLPSMYGCEILVFQSPDRLEKIVEIDNQLSIDGNRRIDKE